jgi:hypothetical protein
MSNVVDLLSRRADRGEQVLHFHTAAEALAYATEQLRDLERLTGSALFVAACDLELPLAQVSAILTECTRLHALDVHEDSGR